FSSRRRHTRSKRDCSSDVCSSDLSSNIPVLENDRLDDELIPVWDVEEPFSANNASIMESSINNGELTTDRPFVLDSTLSESSRLQTASLLNNNEEWLSLVSGLTLESVLSGIAQDRKSTR